MGVERVINGVHTVPMGMANAYLIEDDDGRDPQSRVDGERRDVAERERAVEPLETDVREGRRGFDRELEQAGLVRTAGRRGTVVAEPSSDVGEDARRSASDFVRRMRALGLSPTETVQLVRQAFDH